MILWKYTDGIFFFLETCKGKFHLKVKHFLSDQRDIKG